MLPNFGYVIPGRLAGMARPPEGPHLEPVLQALAGQGIGSIVTLTERPLDARAVEGFGLGYLHLPVPDFTAPTMEQIERFVVFVDERTSQGEGVVVHCAAGIGRTGTFLACYLVRQGLSAREALNEVRRCRPGSVEVVTQEQVIAEYEVHRKGGAER